MYFYLFVFVYLYIYVFFKVGENTQEGVVLLKSIPLNFCCFGNISTLNINGQMLNSIQGAMKLKRLTQLLLQNNQIKELPLSLPQCHPNLTVLDVSNNNLSTLSLNVLFVLVLVVLVVLLVLVLV